MQGLVWLNEELEGSSVEAGDICKFYFVEHNIILHYKNYLWGTTTFITLNYENPERSGLLAIETTDHT
jgi:hypothetical protein